MLKTFTTFRHDHWRRTLQHALDGPSKMCRNILRQRPFITTEKKKQLQQLLSAGQLEEIAGKTTEGSEGLQSGLLASRKKNHTSLPRQADRRDAATAASACSQFTARPIMVRAKAGFELVRKPSYLVGEPCHRWCRAAWTLVRRPLRSMAWCHRPAALPEAI